MNNTENQIVVYSETIPVEYQNEIDALTSLYNKRKELTTRVTQERYLVERISQVDEWYEEELTKIKNKYSLLPTPTNLKDESNLTKVVEESTEVGVNTNTRDLDVTTYSGISMDEFQQKVLGEVENEYVPTEFSLDNHIGYVKDVSVKAGVLVGSYAINAGLTSLGLPPITGLKYIAIGGIKVASVATAAAINYGVQNPGTTVAIVGNLPIAFTYAEKAIKKLKIKEEAPTTPPVNENVVQDSTVVPKPPVDQPIIESHSIYEFFELMNSLTWKILKKLYDLF